MKNIKSFGRLATKATEGKLFICKTVWPLWYTTLKLGEDNLTIVEHRPLAEDVIEIQIKDLLNVQTFAVGPFASLRIYYKYVTGDHKNINWFWRRDASSLRTKAHELMSEASNADQSGGQ